MVRSIRPLIIGAVILLASVAEAPAQSTRVDGGVVSTDTFGFHWETHLTPPVPPLAQGFGTSSSRDTSGAIHRVLLDRVRKIVFGYDVRVDAEPRAADRYRLTFEPLSLTDEQRRDLLGNDFASWTQLPGPGLGPGRGRTISAKSTQMIAIRRGQVIELNLLTTDAGQTLTDYVTIQQPWRQFDGLQTTPPPVFHFTPGQTRDVTLSDVELELVAPRVSVNGKPEPASERSNATARGTVVWFYLPNRGRYVLSLLPRPEFGFRRAGEVRGSTVRFTLGDETFTLLAADQVAPGRAAYNLYVLHDPTWRPAYANANIDIIHVGGADRVEYLLRQ